MYVRVHILSYVVIIGIPKWCSMIKSWLLLCLVPLPQEPWRFYGLSCEQITIIFASCKSLKTSFIYNWRLNMKLHLFLYRCQYIMASYRLPPWPVSIYFVVEEMEGLRRVRTRCAGNLQQRNGPARSKTNDPGIELHRR
jgi:hypothetical protein